MPYIHILFSSRVLEPRVPPGFCLNEGCPVPSLRFPADPKHHLLFAGCRTLLVLLPGRHRPSGHLLFPAASLQGRLPLSGRRAEWRGLEIFPSSSLPSSTTTSVFCSRSPQAICWAKLPKVKNPCFIFSGEMIHTEYKNKNKNSSCYVKCK